MSAPNYETMVKDVLVFLQESNGKKFRIGELAKIFKVPTASMNVILSKIGIQTTMVLQSGRKFYYVMTPADLIEAKRCTAVKSPINRMESKPYKLPIQMIDARKRAEELYPDGGNFKSIS